MRMSKLRLAEYHYRKAADIHPQNAVLLGCVGMVSQSLRSSGSGLCCSASSDDVNCRLVVYRFKSGTAILMRH